MSTPTARNIAVVGLAGRFPGAPDVASLWELLCAGEDAIERFSREELLESGVDGALIDHPGYVPARGVLDEVDGFDAQLFGYSAREAELMDPQHRLFLECAWQALEDSGHDPERVAGRVGVFASSSASTYLLAMLLADPSRAQTMAADLQVMTGNDKDFLATRVCYKLGLRGPGLTVQTACSSSLVGVHLACQSLLSGESDIALAGGVAVQVPHRAGYVYEPDGIYSPDGACRVFDRGAHGTVGGSGVAIVVLRRLADAVRDGDRVVAVVRGSAINNDGTAKVGFTAPSVRGQVAVLADALAIAGVEASSIGLVEAHGTGTALGDPIEVQALRDAYGAGVPNSTALGSVKSNLGHLDAAAGVTGFIKAALAVAHGRVPASLHFEQPNPQLCLDGSAFFVPTCCQDWPQGGLRRAAVSSFGIGGTNAHVILEQAPDPAPRLSATRDHHLLVLSANTPSALATQQRRLAVHLQGHPDLQLTDCARTLACGRRQQRYRCVIVAHTNDQAAGALADSPGQACTGMSRAVAFMFPGGGTQHPGMGAGLYRAEPRFAEQLDRCAELARPHLNDLDLRDIVLDGDSSMLAQTWCQHPALFAVEYALAQLWRSWGIEPDAMIGHSLGEYVAACLAGVFELPDVIALVVARARLLEQTPEGRMLAIALPEHKAREFGGANIDLAAVNAPELCVLAGLPADVQAARTRAQELGIQSGMVRVRRAFHSRVLDSAMEAFARCVADVPLRPPDRPYVSNVTGTWITAEQATDPAYWVRHMREPVRFADGSAELLADPDRALLEIGPGHSLSSLARQQVSKGQLVVSSLASQADDSAQIPSVLEAAGQLWLAGCYVDLAAVVAADGARHAPLPTYPFERQPYWFGGGGEVQGPALEHADPARHERPQVVASYVAPSGELEETLAEIWSELLGFARVGAHDDFFELGGHSLMATQLVGRMREAFPVAIDARQFLERPTVAKQAAVLEELMLAELERLSDEDADRLLASGDDLGRTR